MIVEELTEGYKRNHKCKTPDAIYSTRFKNQTIEVSVKLPKDVYLPTEENELEDIEADLHYAVEKVLAKLFK